MEILSYWEISCIPEEHLWKLQHSWRNTSRNFRMPIQHLWKLKHTWRTPLETLAFLKNTSGNFSIPKERLCNILAVFQQHSCNVPVLFWQCSCNVWPYFKEYPVNIPAMFQQCSYHILAMFLQYSGKDPAIFPATFDQISRNVPVRFHEFLLECSSNVLALVGG